MGCDVLVVDESYEKVQEISDKVSYAVKADVSEPDALQALGGRNLDGVVVAISESLEASIMATMLCKEMGIPLVVAKAKDKLQGAILQRVGADRIVYPEIEMGSRVAKSLVSKEFVDWISLSNDYSMVEIVVPQNWVGKISESESVWESMSSVLSRTERSKSRSIRRSRFGKKKY